MSREIENAKRTLEYYQKKHALVCEASKDLSFIEIVESPYSVERDMKKAAVVVKALEYFESVKDSDRGIDISEELTLDLYNCGNKLMLHFYLKDPIESQLYEYVWSSHSDLNTKVNDIIFNLCEFFFDFKNVNYVLDLGKQESHFEKLEERTLSVLKMAVEFAKSDVMMKKIASVVRDYLYEAIEQGKKLDSEY